MHRPTAVELGLGMSNLLATPRRVDYNNWTLPPYSRWSFQNVQMLTRTARVSRSPTPSLLAEQPQDINRIEFETADGGSMSVSEMLQESWTDGLLVMHQGAIVSEQYFNGMKPDSLHLMMSCSKSMTSAAIGIAVNEGSLDVSRMITDYLPELNGTGFSNATVQQAMDMQVGIKFDEDYENLDGEWRDLEVATGWRVPDVDYTGPNDMLGYMQTLASEGRHGEIFHYQSVLTDAAGLCLERATGLPFPDYFADRIWHRIGAEHDLVTIVDAAGYAVFEGGFNCSLRDFARFADMFCHDGIVSGAEVVPTRWIDECRYPSKGLQDIFARSGYGDFMPDHAYHNFWWVRDPVRGVIMALGIHGQNLFIDADKEVAIAKFSTQPDHVDRAMNQNQFLAYEAIATHLAGE